MQHTHALDSVPKPLYGFFGRDAEIQDIENRLLANRNILLIQGLGGVGKTALLHQMGTRWQKTSFVNQVFYFGYDTKAYTCPQIIESIADLLYVGDTKSEFAVLDATGRQDMLTRDLRAQRHVLILDNLESIIGEPFAIVNTLTEPEQHALRSFLEDLSGGASWVLLGSHGDEPWLAPGTFEDNRVDLSPLDPEAAAELAVTILLTLNITHDLTHPDLQTLIQLLAGHPLALQAILANLTYQTPAEIWEAVQSNFSDEDSDESKTAWILHCIDYTHGHISPEAQGLLACLAPFISVAYGPGLDLYVQQLQQQPALHGLRFELWTEILEQAEVMGLLNLNDDLYDYVGVQPLFSYFLCSRLNEPQFAETQRAIHTAFLRYYDNLGASLIALLLSNDPEDQQRGQTYARLEYDNLATAMDLALAATDTVWNLYFPMSLHLESVYDNEEGLELGKLILECLGSYPMDRQTAAYLDDKIGVMDRIGKCHFLLRHFPEAEHAYQQALEMLLASPMSTQEKREKSAAFYHQLGYLAQEQGHWASSERYFQQELEIYIEFSDRAKQAFPYHSLGIGAQEQGDWRLANHYFQKALELYQEFDNPHAASGVYFHVGVGAAMQQDWATAKQYYLAALDIYQQFHDGMGAAIIVHELGHIAQQQGDWASAESHYQQALAIRSQFDDRYGQGRTYGQLGIVAQKQQQLAQAKEYMLTALEIFRDHNDPESLRITLINLALLWNASRDISLLGTVASMLGWDVSQVENVFQKALRQSEF